jgi:hypothetical protein
MSEPTNPRPFPWWPVLTLAALLTAVALVLRFAGSEAAPADVVLSAVLLTGAVFMLMRWWQGTPWGVAAAALLLVHPLLWTWSDTFRTEARFEALEIILLALAVATWLLTFESEFRWLQWLALTAAAFLATFPLFTWALGPRFVTWFVIVAIVVGVGLRSAQTLRGGARIVPGNVVFALSFAPVLFVATLALAYLNTSRYRGTLLWPPEYRDAAPVTLAPWERDQLAKWAWPSLWLMVPLMAWGLWRTLTRGWSDFKKFRAPISWLLTAYALACALGAALREDDSLSAHVVALATVAVLLAVFGVADFIRGIGERLILLPPEEREPAA